MIVGIEEKPQLQPAVCSFTGHGSDSCSKFIRVEAPNDFYDTLLISDHFFKQMADEMGYIELKQDSKLLKDLQEHIDGLAPTIHSLLSELNSIRERLSNLQTLETNIAGLKATMDSFVGPISSSKSTPKPNSSTDSTGISSSSSKHNI